MTAVETGRGTEAAAPGDVLVRKTFPPITRHMLALYSGASGDHNPIHVDTDFARSAGFPDVFAQGMLVMALMAQAVTDAVPPRLLRSLSTRFRAVTQVGAVLTCEGIVADLLEAGGEARARIALETRDQHRDVKLAGEAIVALPFRRRG